jgi:hypothetical protein
LRLHEDNGLRLASSLSLTPTLPTAIILTLFASLLFVLAGASITAPRELGLFAGSAVVSACGQLIVARAIPGQWPGRLLVAVNVGYAATTLALLFGVFVVGISVLSTMIAWSAAVTLFAALAPTTWKRVAPDEEAAQDVLILAVAAAVVAFACRTAATASSTIRTVGVLPAWTDYFIHGAEISQFAGTHGPIRGDILLAGVSLPLYHYGIYMIPALASRLFGLSGLATACAILLPLGLLVALAGAYALAAALAGRWAGLLALAVFLLLPDSSRYGFRNGLFSFDWLMFTAPGSGYALGIAASAFILAERAGRTTGAVISALLALCLFQIRAQIFALFLPTFTATFLARRNFIRGHAKEALLFLALTTIVAIAVAARSAWLRHVLIYTSDVRDFLAGTFAQQNGLLAYARLYTGSATWPEPLGLIAGAALLVPVMLGAFTLLYPAALGLDRQASGVRTADLFAGLLLAAYVALVVVAPNGPLGGVSEYRQRPFVLIYFWIVSLTATHIANALGSAVRTIGFLSGGGKGPALATLLVGFASIAVLAATRFDPAALPEPWAKDYYRVTVNPGVLAIGEYLNAHARPGDIVAVGPAQPEATLFDRGTMIASLAGLPIYLTTPASQIELGGNRALLARQRLALQTSIDHALTWNAAETIMRTASITWYVYTSSTQQAPTWGAGSPVFANSFGRVYHVQQ